MKVAFAQINTTVGDFAGNVERILAAYEKANAEGADILLTPELAITGYPPQDLVFKSRFVPENLNALETLQAAMRETALVVGFVDSNPGENGRPFYNAAAILERGKPIQIVHKSLLPTYDVFDEARYFEPAFGSEPVEIHGYKVGITICEDIWNSEYLPRELYACKPVQHLVERGAEAILNISASPFQLGKPRQRKEMICALAKKYGVPFFYCNAVGGNDQLVFDGNSLAVSAEGKVISEAPAFEECWGMFSQSSSNTGTREDMEDLHDALALGLRDYMRKCGFTQCVLGLSGGIDSAITACIAVKAVGKENVMGVAMPGPYSSEGSVSDARGLAENLGIQYLKIPILKSFETLKAQMRESFDGKAEDATEENMQARLRGITLMSLSNKFGSLLLTTGNKSELAVGYCTIYGDMCGGLAVISDVPKTMIYELAKWINREEMLIPVDTITKPPSAELRPDQKDQDTLPPYEILDEILRLYVEENYSGREIVECGFEETIVRWVIRRVDLNEYKREQAAPGLKVTGRAFGIGRRMPIAQRFE
ncbi:MAG: NAD+ synthase [Chthoniobacterales bacterium]